ncbi:hypothetical protein ACIBW9_01910 [Streptomyces sp. NPDC049541]|uniref:hypothetical protein n=1 Tax=Streptomyces sp. NPDC049541 TaxID=3365594 RepID=UPI0037B9A3CF
MIVAVGGAATFWLYFTLFDPWPSVPQDQAEGKNGDSTKEEQTRNRRHFFVYATIVVVALIFVISLLIVLPVVDGRAHRVVSGKRVTPVMLFDTVILDLHAHPVKRVSAIAEASQSAVPAGRLMYLGNADRSYVLYDVDSKGVVRLSVERFVLST